MCVSQGFLVYTDSVLSSLTTVMPGTGTRFKDIFVCTGKSLKAAASFCPMPSAWRALLSPTHLALCGDPVLQRGKPRLEMGKVHLYS